MTRLFFRSLPCRLVILCLFLCCACSGNDAEAPRVEDGEGTLYLIELGGHSLAVEVAVTQMEQRKGLMFREKLPEDHGMLFIFQHPMRLKFWMKNTSIPLDIGYFDQKGILKEIHSLRPFDLDAVESRGHDLQFALEVNRGWFSRNGIGLGDKLPVETLAEILLDRNIPPHLFGLLY